MTQPLTSLYGAVDHTYLKTNDHGVSLESQKENIKKLVHEAQASHACSVCIHGHMVDEVRSILESSHNGNQLKVSVVTGFPSVEASGVRSSLQQIHELKPLVDEFDMVMDYRGLLDGKIQKVKDHIMSISDAVGSKTLKVIFENCYLSMDQIKAACEVLNQAFSDLNLREQWRMAKTSTGFAPKLEFEKIGAVIEDVQVMRAELLPDIGIKVAGGIKDLNHAWNFYEVCKSPKKDSFIDTRLFRVGSSSLIPTQIKGTSYE